MSIILFLVLCAMALIAGGFVLSPLFKRLQPVGKRAAYDQMVFRDQLAELEHDLDRGVINAAQGDAAQAEIGRRLLAASKEAEHLEPEPASGRALTFGFASLAIVVPIFCGVFYLFIGSPNQPGLPFAERRAENTGPEMTLEKFAKIISMVALGVEMKPNEIAGWKILSTGYLRLGRDGDAEKAFSRALELAKGNPVEAATIAANFGEALVARQNGRVTPRARRAFERAHGLAPKLPKPRYYLGLALLQSGDAKSALALWTQLAAEAPPNAPWLGILKKRIERIKKERPQTPSSRR
ncbi:MAG: c-type cytochrome biogenesis protein CcmI [Alphaproteobacteria bacterium]|jgi:cytochrome c-type biogenesis protein CcmH